MEPMRWWASPLAAAVLLGALSAPGRGADDSTGLFDLPLEGLTDLTVVTTSRFEQALFDSPGIISVFTRQDIEAFGANNLIEVIERLPGVQTLTGYVFQNNAISIRGDLPNQNDNHVLILVNGRPLRTGFSGGFNGIVWNSFPVDAIERIEYVRGPGSVLYGSNAFSGVINLITRQAGQERGGVSFTTGSDDTRAASGYAQHAGDDFDLRVQLESFSEDGWHGRMVDEVGVASEDDFGEDNLTLFANGHVGNLSLDLFLADTEQTHFGSVPRWPTQDIERDIYFLGIGHQYALNREWTLHSSFTYNYATQEYPRPFNTEFDGQSDDTTVEAYVTGDVRERTKLILGGSLSRLTGNVGGGSITLPDYDWTWWSLFGQASHRFHARLLGFLGAQWNKAEGVDAEIVPRIGVVYRFNPDLGVKLLYSEAFRSPYPAETDVQAQPILTGNSDLGPEIAKTLDLQWFYDTGRYQAALTLFRTKQTDLIDRAAGSGPGVPGTFQNLSERDIEGIELEWRLRPSPRWELLGSAQLQRNEDQAGTDDVTLAPDLLFKFGAVFRPRSGFSIGLYDIYTDDYADVSIIKPAANNVNPKAEAHHLLSVNGRFELGHWLPGAVWRRVELELYGSNLLDETVYVPEYSRGFINTLPAREGRALFASLHIGLE